MRPFAYERASDAAAASVLVADEPDATFLAGGTELVNWLKEGIVRPSRVVDINGLGGLAEIEATPERLRIGALTRMSDVAAHRAVRQEYRAIAEALLKSASQQLRNMASMGGNLMQKTRCPYFRADVALPCNKRAPGSGCSMLEGNDRAASIFGWSDACLATHPSDVAVALAALDAVVEVQSAGTLRTLPIDEFYRLPDDDPARETTLRHGDLIVAIDVPASAAARRSHYLKVRERGSYEFALVSVAMGVEIAAGEVATACIALGGVAPKPWRLRQTEAALCGREFTASAIRSALDADFAGARPRRENAFKIELAKRAVVRAAQALGAPA